MTWINKNVVLRPAGKSIAAGAASIIIPIGGTPERLEIVMTNLVPSVTADLQATYSVDGGNTYLSAGYYWSFSELGSAAATPTQGLFSSGASAALQKLMAGLPSGAVGSQCRLELSTPKNGASYKTMLWEGVYRASGTDYRGVRGHGSLENVTAITHIKIAPSTGNLSGVFSVNAKNG